MPLTPEEFAAKMAAIHTGDTEIAHGEADGLLCETLIDLGYGEGVATFFAMDKWYA